MGETIGSQMKRSRVNLSCGLGVCVSVSELYTQGFKPPFTVAWRACVSQHDIMATCPCAHWPLWGETAHQPASVNSSKCSGFLYIFISGYTPPHPSPAFSGWYFFFCNKSLSEVDLKLQSIGAVLFWRRGADNHFCDGELTSR